MNQKAIPREPEQPAPQKYEMPQVRKIGFSDLREVLGLGWRDFMRAPKFGMFFGGIYALGGLLIFYVFMKLKLGMLVFPMVFGFALIGPFIASGLYEVSRRLEKGTPLVWSEVLGVCWNQHRRELGWMAFVMLFIFWIWMYQSRTLVAVFFGTKGFATLPGFLEAVFTTSTGATFLLVGTLVGATISMILFTLTVISCPILLERDVDFVTAMITSVRAVTTSPIVMLSWGAFVVLAVIISAIPAFLGLLIVLPVLGHATWHLYKRVVVEEG